MGNVMQTDFFEIWNNKIYRKYRKDLLLEIEKINLVPIVMLAEPFMVSNMRKIGKKFLVNN